MRTIIVGGVAAGMSAASRIKRDSKDSEVVVYEMGEHVSYGACGLPYFIADYNTDWQKLIARPLEKFIEAGIDVRLRHEVVRVQPDLKTVLVRNHSTGDVFTDKYDTLFIATGAQPIMPAWPGIELPGVFSLKSLTDSFAIKEAIKQSAVRHVTIIGGGYIGVEMIEAAVALGKTVRCIEAVDRILTPFEPEMSELATRAILDQGVEINLAERVVALEGKSHIEAVRTDRGTYQTDLVIVAVGVKPATAFLQSTGIRMAANGALVIDREMRTSLPGIYAAGDCALVHHRISEDNHFLPLGTNANKLGRLAAQNMLGTHQKYAGTLGSAAIKVFELELARTGLSEIDCQRLGIDYQSIVVTAGDHPAYYPNPKPIRFKLIYERQSKKILGAQAAGEQGAVLRIDALAIALHAGLTTTELSQVDLCYAPPFASVWDVIHIACQAAK